MVKAVLPGSLELSPLPWSTASLATTSAPVALDTHQASGEERHCGGLCHWGSSPDRQLPALTPVLPCPNPCFEAFPRHAAVMRMCEQGLINTVKRHTGPHSAAPPPGAALQKGPYHESNAHEAQGGMPQSSLRPRATRHHTGPSIDRPPALPSGRQLWQAAFISHRAPISEAGKVHSPQHHNHIGPQFPQL